MKITNLFRMSSDKGRTCAFTGHRPQNLPFRFNENDDRCIALKQKLRDCIVQLIEQEGVRHFISGMAIGVDMYAAEIVLELKAEYPFITLEAAIPCETQAAKWSEPLRDRYYKIAELCDPETIYIRLHAEKEPIHGKSCRYTACRLGWIIERNRLHCKIRPYKK